MVKDITLEAIQELYLTTTPKSLGIADLGCSSGPNTLSIIKDIIEAVQRTSRKIFHPTPEFRVYLNDLPSNDFNSIFKALPDFSKGLSKERNDGSAPIYIGGYPGSFYGRLFPNNSLHFVYSSCSLHWLSRVRYSDSLISYLLICFFTVYVMTKMPCRFLQPSMSRGSQ